MAISGPRLNNFESRQATTSSVLISTSTYSTRVTVSVPVPPTTETVTATTATETVIATVYVPHTTPLQSPPGPQTTTIIITSSIISTTTNLSTCLTLPPACVSAAADTIPVSSAILTAVAASSGSQPPLPDRSSQRTITGLAVALAVAVIIACLLVWLFWRRKGKAKRESLSTRRSFSAFEPKSNGSWNPQPATRSTSLVSHTSEPYKPSGQKSVAYGSMVGYLRFGQDSSGGVTYSPESQTKTLNVDGNEEFFPRSLSQCTEIGTAI